MQLYYNIFWIHSWCEAKLRQANSRGISSIFGVFTYLRVVVRELLECPNAVTPCIVIVGIFLSSLFTDGHFSLNLCPHTFIQSEPLWKVSFRATPHGTRTRIIHREKTIIIQIRIQLTPVFRGNRFQQFLLSSQQKPFPVKVNFFLFGKNLM